MSNCVVSLGEREDSMVGSIIINEIKMKLYTLFVKVTDKCQLVENNH